MVDRDERMVVVIVLHLDDADAYHQFPLVWGEAHPSAGNEPSPPEGNVRRLLMLDTYRLTC